MLGEVINLRMARHLFAFMLTLMLPTWIVYAADTVYFPKGAEHWYPKYLEAMKEPSLYEQRTNNTIEQYRFLWLRTFHKPIAIRVRKDNAGITLRVVRLSGAGGYDPGKIEHDESCALTAAQWDELLKLLGKASFWGTPTVENYSAGFDGSQWILEGQSAGKYHVVDRWTPSAENDQRHLDRFVICCRYLLTLSKQEIPKKDDY